MPTQRHVDDMSAGEDGHDGGLVGDQDAAADYSAVRFQ